MKGLFVYIWSMVMVFLLAGMFGQGYFGLTLVAGITISYAVWRKRRGSDDFKINQFSKQVVEEMR